MIGIISQNLNFRKIICDNKNNEPCLSMVKEKYWLEKSPVKILLVEDNHIVQKIIKIFISDLGYNCDVAATGQEARKLYIANRYDLVLMDIELPDTTGIILTKLLRENAKNSYSVPIVAMTSHTEEKYKISCREAGMDGYANKPQSSKELEMIISQHIAKK